MSPFGEGAMAGGDANERLPGPYDEIGRVIAELARPRRVRMSRRGKLTAVMVAAILLASMVCSCPVSLQNQPRRNATAASHSFFRSRFQSSSLS
jgi:hypothetical protein